MYFLMRGIHGEYFVVRFDKLQSARVVSIVRRGGLVWEADWTGFMGIGPELRARARGLLDRCMKIEKPLNWSKRK